MSSSIPSTGLFVEAAYGVEAVPGQVGTAGSDMENLAWQQAMGAALGTRMVGEGANPALDTPLAGGELGEESEDSLALESPMNNADLKERNPIAWDRLSMTVSSMVAWGMQVEMAEDEPSAQIDTELVSETAALVGVDKGDRKGLMADWNPASLVESEGLSNKGMTSAPANAVPLADSGNQAVNGGQVSSIPDGQQIGSGVLNLGTAPDDAISQQVIEQLVSNRPVSSPGVDGSVATEQSIQEAVPLRDRTVQMAIEGLKRNDGEPKIPLMPIQENTTSSRSDQAVSTKTQSMNMGDVDPSSVPAVKRVSLGDNPGLKVIQQVHDSSVENQQAMLGRQRLEGIRSVLAELDAQVDLETVSDVVRRPLDTEAARSLMGRDVAARGVSPLSSRSTNLNGPMGETTPSSDNAPSGSGEVDTSVGEAELPLTDEEMFAAGEKRSPESVRSKAGTNAMKMNAPKAVADLSNTQTDLKAHVAGNESAEIVSDQENLLRVQVADAKTIDASETPELAMQDLSQLDLDIEDPMGTVRLAMSKEAEEVSIRLQTPQEVLEEYREMREEIDEKLLEQGLDLSEFSANADDDSPDKSDGDGKGNQVSNQAAEKSNEDGQIGLANEGSSARLINRIV